MKYVDIFLKHFFGTPIFTMKDAERFLCYNKAGKTYSKRFIQNLIHGKKIFRVAKGVYTIHGSTEVIGFAFSPFYYGLADALSYHNIWEERANRVILTTRIVRTGQRKSMGMNISVFRLPRRLFFGYTMEKGERFYYPVSDLEKTFIDIVYFGINLRRDTLEKLISKLNPKKLSNYLLRYPENLQKKIKQIYPNTVHLE